MPTPAFSLKTSILYGELKKLGQQLPFSLAFKTNFSLGRGGFRLDFENGSELYLVVSRFVKYMEAGEFKASSAFALRNGPVLGALRGVAPTVASGIDNPWASGSSWYLVPELWANRPQWDYVFLNKSDVAALSRQVVEDIKNYLFPPMVAFVEDYSAAADIFLQGEVAQLRIKDPFAIGLTILKLAGRLDEAERLAARASSMKETFYDYAPKKGEALIARFRKSEASSRSNRARPATGEAEGTATKTPGANSAPMPRQEARTATPAMRGTTKKATTKKATTKKATTKKATTKKRNTEAQRRQHGASD